LTDDVNMAGTIAAEHAKLVLDAAEIGEAKGGDIFVDSLVAGKKGKFGGWFGGFVGGPDDVGGFDVSVREMVDGGKFGNI